MAVGGVVIRDAVDVQFAGNSLVDLTQETDSVGGAKLTRAGAERADVLWEAAAPEAQPRVQEARPDALVITQSMGQRHDIGIRNLANFRHRIDERNLRCKK